MSTSKEISGPWSTLAIYALAAILLFTMCSSSDDQSNNAENTEKVDTAPQPVASGSNEYRATETPTPQLSEAENSVAALINLNGHLCAKIVNVTQLKMRENVFEVTCIEYRGGTGTVRYLVDGNNSIASPL